MTMQEFRKKHNLTLEEMAGLVGVSKQAVAIIETGGGCHLKTARRIVEGTKGEVQYEDLLVDPALAPNDHNQTSE